MLLSANEEYSEDSKYSIDLNSIESSDQILKNLENDPDSDLLGLQSNENSKKKK